MNKMMYCAVGDYGIETYFPTQRQCEEWIEDQMNESRQNDPGNPLPDGYYTIKTFTQAEIDAMPED